MSSNSVDQSKTEINLSNVGLYSGNVIIEYNTDQKVVKPVIKVNEKATKEEVLKAVDVAIFALKESSLALRWDKVVVPDPLSNIDGMEFDGTERLVADPEGGRTKLKKIQDIYANNDHISNNEQTGVDHHLE